MSKQELFTSDGLTYIGDRERLRVEWTRPDHDFVDLRAADLARALRAMGYDVTPRKEEEDA